MSTTLKPAFSLIFVLLAVGCSAEPESINRQKAPPMAASASDQPQAIRDRLNSSNPLERAHGIRLLGESEQAADFVVPQLLNSLADPNYLVRQRAAEALGKRGDHRAIKPLMAALQRGSEYPEVRSRAAEALGYLEAAEAVDPLKDCLNGMVWNVRYQAVIALGRIGDPSVCEAVEQVVRYDPNFSVRTVAREALEKLNAVVGNEQDASP